MLAVSQAMPYGISLDASMTLVIYKWIACIRLYKMDRDFRQANPELSRSGCCNLGFLCLALQMGIHDLCGAI